MLSCYEKLHAVARAWQVPHFPNVHAVAAAIAEEDPAQNKADSNSRQRHVSNQP